MLSQSNTNSGCQSLLRPRRLFLERQKNVYRVHSVACAGTEVHLAACPMEFNGPNGTASCRGGSPVVVSCMPGPLFAQQHGGGLKKKAKTSVRAPPRSSVDIAQCCGTPGFCVLVNVDSWSPLFFFFFNCPEHSEAEGRGPAGRGPRGGAEERRVGQRM